MNAVSVQLFPKLVAFSAREPEEIPSVISAQKFRSTRVTRLMCMLKKTPFLLVFGSLDYSNCCTFFPMALNFPFAFCNADLGKNSKRLKSLGCTHNTQERRVLFPSSYWTTGRVGNWPPATGMAMLGSGMVEEPVPVLLRSDQTVGFPFPPGSSRERLDPVSSGWILARLWGMWV